MTLILLSTPCATPECAHPYNWHTADGCQFDNETNRCGCIAFAAPVQDGAQR
ncbi:hypothetical protein KBZ00_25885 [Streptomyces sp. RK31]|uniref:hypothetical protein n=1 Tax=Streptomyces sp. RK31 TaxID=2824892 RepID=UPI001B399110|nr:hypothetical protein [Streptomyces sp. RK31]MBQ0974531.1 hypothetical protein [Streptomyces sp. RK31]